jgi:hypothetical protein
VPTASEFHRIVTPKGNPSKSQDGYIFDLIAERITGEPADPFSSKWTIRGTELESEAVTYYELIKQCETESIGFVTNDTFTMGASPDRMVTPKHFLEIKVPKPGVHLSYLVQYGAVYDDHGIQAQSQLWIAEGEQVDLVSYCAKLPYALYPVHRDDKFIKSLEEHVPAFIQRLEGLYQKLLKDGIVSGAPEWSGDRFVKGVDESKAPDNPLTQILRESLISINQH